MTTATYLEVKAVGGAVNPLLSRIVEAVHYANWEGCDLGLSFPHFNDSEANDFGDTVRVFGTEDQLFDFYVKLNENVRSSAIKISEIADTPTTTSYVSFARDRAVERAAPCNVKRKMARSAARGEVYTAPTPNAVKHILRVSSVSAKGSIHIPITKTTTAREGGAAYGLGKLVPAF